jgi:hypothetical protein
MEERIMACYDEHEQFGEFLAFFAHTYYPYGGLEDCLGCFDYLENAWEAIAKKREKTNCYGVMHVVNIRTRLVYDKPDQTEGVELDTWIANQKEDDE